LLAAAVLANESARPAPAALLSRPLPGARAVGRARDGQVDLLGDPALAAQPGQAEMHAVLSAAQSAGEPVQYR